MLPATPLAHTLGFQPLPGAFFAAPAGLAACYLGLIEIAKRIFYRAASTEPRTRRHDCGRRYLRRRAAHFSTA